jgi:anti-sigma factor RsiW
MNCRHFQNRLHEYVEGSLSAGAQMAAEKHLSECGTCREAARREQQAAQFLSDGLRQSVESLVLRPEIRHRILTAPKSEPAAHVSGGAIIVLWHRYAWPMGIGAALLLIAAMVASNHFSGARRADSRTISVVSVEDSYRVPVYNFRREGNFVVDSISDETVVISETIRREKPVREKQERKAPL